MNTTPVRKMRTASRGVALIIALVLLVLLSGIVLAFFASVRTELTSSKSYESGTSARILADSAVNLVIAQIREASTQRDQAWISQPGLIRTFNEQGQAVKAYKLYSAGTMVMEGAFDPAADAASGKGDLPALVPLDSPEHWKNRPALWTDLNAPAINHRLQPPRGIYPIFDGNDLQQDPKSAAVIIDADRDGVADVEGFRIEAPVEEAATMPVRWLYILQDGTLVPCESTPNPDEAKLLVPAGKEKDANGNPNPVVARIAFWTDDETSKVNINTASEGAFWDTPMCNSQPGISKPWTVTTPRPDTLFEWDLAERMGAQKEYQRYPGHPATTCLSPVLWTPLAQANGMNPNDPANYTKLLEMIYQLTPRVVGYDRQIPPASPDDLVNPVFNRSSQGGTRRAGAAGKKDMGLKLTPDSDRLYAMTDELIFDPVRLTNKFGDAKSTNVSDVSRRVLETSKFFLTAHSRAPEQNLWNRPRVAVWPIHTSAAKRTAFDQLIAFCSTVGRGADAKPYYLSRTDPMSGVTDFNPRNQQIYEFLQGLMRQPVPANWEGNSGTRSLAAKHGPDVDQILTEVFDYVRCTNLIDASDYRKSYTELGYALAGDPPVAPLTTAVVNTSRGQVVPLDLTAYNGTRGIGRIATISELALVIIRKGPPAGKKTHTELEFSLVPQLFSPMAGYSALANDIKITFESINLRVTDPGGKSYNPFATLPTGPQRPFMHDRRISNIRGREGKLGGQIGYRSLIENSTDGDVGIYRSSGAPVDSVPPTGEITVDFTSDGQNAAAAPKLTISGSVEVTIHAPAKDGKPIQTIKFEFPSASVPIPNRLAGEMASQNSTTPQAYPSDTLWRRGGRIPAVSQQFEPFRMALPPANQPQVIRSGSPNYDTVRTVVAANGKAQILGDMRMVAAEKDPSRYFGTVPKYANSSGVPGIHSFRSSWERVADDADFGALVKSIPTSSYKVSNYDSRPPIPEGINGVTNHLGKTGDWDNGPGALLDGALCNKPDEGADRHHAAWALTTHDSLQFIEEPWAPYIGTKFQGEDSAIQHSSFFSPNRQIPSAVMLGSLPTGVKRDRPWQTLLFRPAKSYFPGGADHPGGGGTGPPDHFLLDLFWMPIVEPYAISEPFATAGKINLNYQIAPFTRIKRDTGLRAVLKSTKIGALNPDQTTTSGTPFVGKYKMGGVLGDRVGSDAGAGVVTRRNIDLDNTLKQIEHRFKAATGSGTQGNRPFISASEICEIPLIPKDVVIPKELQSVMKPHVSAGFTSITPLSSFDALLANFWAAHQLTGDNSLERPYAHIYPRLTTRSNTYTVHVRVQTLKKASGGDPWIIKEGRDEVGGEFRGSFIVERYLDPNGAGFVNRNEAPAKETDPDAVLGPYRFRVVASKQFVH